MSYLDPFQLLQLQVSDPQAVTHEMIQAARAQLDATLQTMPGDPVQIAGKTIFKADAQELSAAMLDPIARQRFWEMRKVAELVGFLEGAPVRNVMPILVRCEQVGADFHAFASHWIAKRIDELIDAALSQSKWIVAIPLCKCIPKLNPLSENLAVRAASEFFSLKHMEIVNRMAGGVGGNSLDNLRSYFHPPMLGVLNSLPDSCFPLRDAYALSLGKLAMELANATKNQLWHHAIVEAATQIRTSPTAAQQVKFFHERVREDTGIVAAEMAEARKRRNAATIAGVIAVLAAILEMIQLLT